MENGDELRQAPCGLPSMIRAYRVLPCGHWTRELQPELVVCLDCQESREAIALHELLEELYYDLRDVLAE